jgi:hypothetical protein
MRVIASLEELTLFFSHLLHLSLPSFPLAVIWYFLSFYLTKNIWSHDDENREEETSKRKATFCSVLVVCIRYEPILQHINMKYPAEKVYPTYMAWILNCAPMHWLWSLKILLSICITMDFPLKYHDLSVFFLYKNTSPFCLSLTLIQSS